MPRFTPAPAPKCPRCGDSIFATELKIGPNATAYHARCLTCTLCNKRLDSSLLLEHEGQPYCKHCHAKLLGTGANGFTRAVPLQPRSPEAAGVRVGAFASPHSPSTAAAAVPGASPSPSAYRSSSSNAFASPSAGSPAPRVGGIVRGRVDSVDASSHDGAAASNVARIASPVRASSRATEASPQQRYASRHDYDDEFGPPPSSTAAQTMDDLVNQVHSITIRPRGAGIVPAPANHDDAYEPAGTTPRATDVHTEDNSDAASLLSDTASTTATVGTPGALPPPRRQMPVRSGGGGGPGYKTAPPAYGGGTSGVSRLGLASSVSAAAGGTPLCARCSKPVYFAEQKQGAGRKWHRGCLRCDGCSTILDSGRLEEGPADGAGLAAELNPAGGAGANVWCRNCYAKHFGPKGIGVGMSVPEALRR